MRDLKFKVFIKKYEMIRDVIYFDDKIVKYWDHPSKNAAEIKWYTNICSRENSEIIQYTWLKDKNWVEIYEGGILKWHFNNWYTKKWCDTLRLVWYSEQDCAFHTQEFKPHKSKWFDRMMWKYNEWDEIIWNIYENPELLWSKK